MNRVAVKNQPGYTGTIDASNKHLFSPALQEVFEFFEQWGDKPFDPEKNDEAFRVAFKWSWKEKISLKKQETPAMPFKEIAVAVLEDAPADWTAEEMADLIRWAERVWQES